MRKSKANVEKLVDDQARGKAAKRSRSKKSTSRSGELDTRESKFYNWIKA